MGDPDPFSAFSDWRIDRPGDPWPEFWEDNALSPEQAQIVARNAEMLVDRQVWAAHAEAFETAVAALPEEPARAAKRAEFAIRFDKHRFEAVSESFDVANYRFPCAVSFSGVSFGKGNVSFDGASFGDGDVWFDGAKFGRGYTLFVKANFGKGHVSFDRSKFGDGGASFDLAKFAAGDVWFVGTAFGNGRVSFGGVKFGDGNIRFDEAKFGEGDTSFAAAEFGRGDVSFHRARFGEGDTSFAGVRFGIGLTSFKRVKFGDGDVSFNGARFDGGKVLFDSSEFGNSNVSFYPAKLVDSALSFQNTRFAGSLFVRVITSDSANFQRLSVSGTADFSDCHFEIVPNFRDAKFDRPPEVARLQVAAPRMVWTIPGRADLRNFVRLKRFNPALAHLLFALRRLASQQVSADPEDVAKLRKLKGMALAAYDHERDGAFFALEMRAKRGHEKRGFCSLLLDDLYFLLSDYGQSVRRPFLALCGSFAAFSLLYALALFQSGRLTLESIWLAIEYSLRNTLPFVNTLFRFALQPEGYETGFQQAMSRIAAHNALGWDHFIFLAVAQQFFGALFLFLLLLGLRNRFRLK